VNFGWLWGLSGYDDRTGQIILLALSFWWLVDGPDDLAAVRVCPPAATKLSLY
jgi:hypothetical protein